jgi:hypothetical protein
VNREAELAAAVPAHVKTRERQQTLVRWGGAGNKYVCRFMLQALTRRRDSPRRRIGRDGIELADGVGIAGAARGGHRELPAAAFVLRTDASASDVSAA